MNYHNIMVNQLHAYINRSGHRTTQIIELFDSITKENIDDVSQQIHDIIDKYNDSSDNNINKCFMMMTSICSFIALMSIIIIIVLWIELNN